MTNDPIETLRRLCLALPEVTERLSHGEPTWFVQGKKTFVTVSDHHHDDRVAFWCAAPPGAQEVLVGADPKRFFRPKYVGHRGWLGVYLDVPQDWHRSPTSSATPTAKSPRSACSLNWTTSSKFPIPSSPVPTSCLLAATS